LTGGDFYGSVGEMEAGENIVAKIFWDGGEGCGVQFVFVDGGKTRAVVCGEFV